MSHHSAHVPDGPAVWQRAVPVLSTPYLTPAFRGLAALAALGLLVIVVRTASSLGPFSGMTDHYPWGVWKTFNVMTLTALGSGGLAVGLLGWVFARHRLHAVMRVAIVTSFLFYLTGLGALVADMGRPWNFWNAAIPSRWNTHSALFEIAVAMPVYCMIFLLFETLPMVFERLQQVGPLPLRRVLKAWEPRLRTVFPWMVAGAYLTPLGHQSSLGALMLLAGPKLDPIWQTQWLPLLYLGQAIITGLAFVTFILLASCLVWRRPVDVDVIDELASWISWLSLGWLALRAFDLLNRGVAGSVLATGLYPALFWIETLLVLVPAVGLRFARRRRTMHSVFVLSVVAIAGGMAYRFIPTTIAFDPGKQSFYFPTTPEILVTVGLVALALALWTLAVKFFAILPAPRGAWDVMVEHDRRRFPDIPRNAAGYATDLA